MKRLVGMVFAGVLGVPLVFCKLVGCPSHIVGYSMEPTLFPGDIVWVNRLFAGSPSVGDIYCFKCPFDPTQTFIKRVAALEGQIVLNKWGEEVNVSRNHLWMRSDNTSMPVLDSAHFGEVNYGLLEGKAVYVIWPPDRWKSLAQR